MGKTVAEKIFDSHVVDRPAEDVWVLRLDAVFCHEITTPIAIDRPDPPAARTASSTRRRSRRSSTT